MRQNWLNIAGKVVIVTGGAAGIGKCIAETLAEHGAKVVVADVMPGEFADGQNIFCEWCDISKEDSVHAMVEKVIDTYGRIDVLINNAGVNYPRLLVDTRGENPEYELDEKTFDKMFSINVKGTFLCAQACAKHMVRQGEGVILNMSSESGKEGSAGQSAYAATKGAVDSLTRSWAKELGKHGIRVLAVAPGIMETTNLRTPSYEKALAYTREIREDAIESDYTKVIPLGRAGKLTEVADFVAYLISERATYITGTTLNISGGKSRG